MINFSELGLQEEREIRCLVSQDFKKKIRVHYSDYENVKNKIGQKVVTVYEANEDDRKIIIDLVEQGIKEQLESGNAVEKNNLTISGVDFIVLLLQRLTDINLDIDIIDAKAIEKILNKPTNLLLAIHKEINAMCNHIIDEIYENMVSFSERPEGVRQFLLEQYNREVVEEEKAKEETAENDGEE